MQGISALAIPWYVVNDLGLSYLWGWIYFAVTGVVLFWGVYAGTLVDRYKRKVILTINPLICGLILMILSKLFINGSSNIFLCSFCFLGIFLSYSLYFPNLYAVCQEMAEKKDYGKISSILEIQGQLSLIFAGSIAALLMHGAPNGLWPVFGVHIDFGLSFNAWGIDDIIFYNGIGLVLSSTMTFWINYDVINKREIDMSGIFKRINTGFRFLFKNRFLFLFGLTSFSVFFAIIIINFMVSPQYIAQHLNGSSEVYGISEVYFGIGSALAGALAIKLFSDRHALYGISLLIGLAALVLIYFLFNTSVFIYYLCFAILGFSNAGTRVLRITYLLKMIPTDVVGRANSVFNVLNTFARLIFVGIFTMPFFTYSNNVIYAMLILGVVLMLCLGIGLYHRKSIIALVIDESYRKQSG